jgi:hypothetical protein
MNGRTLNNLSETDLYIRLLRLEDHVLDGRTPQQFNTDQFVEEANLASRDEIAELAPVTSVDGETGDVDHTDIRVALNDLYIQAAKHDFELALEQINYLRGDFNIYANSDDIKSQNNVTLSLREYTSTVGYVELETDATSGTITHDISEAAIQPTEAIIGNDLTITENGGITYTLVGDNGNTVTISESEIDTKVDTSNLTSHIVELKVELTRTSTTDTSPRLQSWGVYFDGSRLSSWFEVNQTGLSTV